MRRFVTISVVMVAVGLGAAVPALRAAAQLVDVRVADQLVGAADQIVGGTDQLITTDPFAIGQLVVTADQLVAAGTTADLTGTLVDASCYAARGKDSIKSADHAKCAIACAQKGGRVALVTDKGDVYMVIGAFTQNNNNRLIQLLNKSIVLTGLVGVRPAPVVVPVPTGKDDGRRPTGNEDGVISKATLRKGDFREGDLPNAPEATIEPTAFKILQQ